jgi:calcium/calmodulin-dependent protein kinase I
MKQETFSEAECREIMVPLFDAIIYCHKLGIVHRDIKPENLLFSQKKDGIIKVSDFGLARILPEDKFATTTCGTPGYVAPEIVDEKPYKEQADFWSLGVVMYILLCGEPPFYHDDNFEMFELIKRGNYSMTQPQWKNVSESGIDLIKRLLVVDPAKRITAKEL